MTLEHLVDAVAPSSTDITTPVERHAERTSEGLSANVSAFNLTSEELEPARRRSLTVDPKTPEGRRGIDVAGRVNRADPELMPTGLEIPVGLR